MWPSGEPGAARLAGIATQQDGESKESGNKRGKEQRGETARPAVVTWRPADVPKPFSGKREDYAGWKKTTKRIMEEQEWNEAQIYSWLTDPANMDLGPEQAYWIRIYSTSAGVWEALDDNFPEKGYALKRLINELKAISPPDYGIASQCRVFASALRGADEKAGIMREQLGRDVVAEVFSRDMEVHFRRNILNEQWEDEVDNLATDEPDTYNGSVGWMRALAMVARRRVTTLMRREEFELEDVPVTVGKRVQGRGSLGKMMEVELVGGDGNEREEMVVTAARPAKAAMVSCPWCGDVSHSKFCCPRLRGNEKQDRRLEAQVKRRCARCMEQAANCRQSCSGVVRHRGREWSTDCPAGCRWEGRPAHARLCPCPEVRRAGARG